MSSKCCKKCFDFNSIGVPMCTYPQCACHISVEEAGFITCPQSPDTSPMSVDEAGFITCPTKPPEQKCCDKCHDVYFDKTYPAHTAYDACVNLGCECHHIVQVDEMVAPPATEAWERAERTAWQKFACRNEIDDTGVLEAIDDAENYWIERLSTQASRILEELKVKIGGMKLEGFNDKHEVNHTLDAVIKML